MPRILSKIKNLIFSSEEIPRTIRSGLLQGIKMELNLASQTQVYLGFYEKEIHRVMNKLSTAVSTAIDIGAAEGIYTLYFLAKTPAKKVFSFEPNAKCRSKLILNTNLNNLTNSYKLELSSKFVGLKNNDNECTLNSLLPKISFPCLIKMDVEGEEVKILQKG